MKLKKIKWENIFLIMVVIQFIDWALKGALNYNYIIYFMFIYIIYNTIRYIRRYEED